jgi:hypothetical protein
MERIKAQHVKSQFRLCIEQATSLGQVSLAILQTKPNDRIIQCCQGVTSTSEGQTSGILPFNSESGGCFVVVAERRRAIYECAGDEHQNKTSLVYIVSAHLIQ